MLREVLELAARLPAEERRPFIDEALAELDAQESLTELYAWRETWARPSQLAPPGDWDYWLLLAGRGFGKTRSGVEWVREMAEANPGCRIALVGRTAADARDVIVEGESGLLAVSPPWAKPDYEPSKRRLTWPNGTIATTYSADEPDVLRGPQHHFALAEELASWKYLEETWDNVMFGLRLGSKPRVAITTTPRPLPLLRRLLKDPACAVTRGSTYDNAANLPEARLREFRQKYEGTRVGRQELMGEVLDDVPGALWNRAMLDGLRVKKAPELVRVMVGVDPAVTSGEDSCDTGIVGVGKGADGHLYVLQDRSCHMSPDGWARRAVVLFDEVEGDRIVGEVNNGGDLVEHTVRTVRKAIPFRAVRASRGKRVRAEPIAALYEQGRVHHVGALPELEDQMCTFLPEGSDAPADRVDALVWAATELMASGGGAQATRALAGVGGSRG